MYTNRLLCQINYCHSMYTNRLLCQINYCHSMFNQCCSPCLSMKAFVNCQTAQCDTWHIGIRYFPFLCIRRKCFFFEAATRKCVVKWSTEFGYLNRGDMLTSEQHRCTNEKKNYAVRYLSCMASATVRPEQEASPLW